MRREGDPQRREKEGGRAEEEEERFIQNSRSEQLELRGGLRARPRHPGGRLAPPGYVPEADSPLSLRSRPGWRTVGGRREEREETRGGERERRQGERRKTGESNEAERRESRETRRGFKERGGTVREAEK